MGCRAANAGGVSDSNNVILVLSRGSFTLDSWCWLCACRGNLDLHGPAAGAVSRRTGEGISVSRPSAACRDQLDSHIRLEPAWLSGAFDDLVEAENIRCNSLSDYEIEIPRGSEMSGVPESDSSSLVSLLIEHSRGTFEVVLRRVEIQDKVSFLPVQILPVSGAQHAMPTHSCLGNALSMLKWMEDHPEVFQEGQTASI